jgi:aryl-alcohol dehydrogenase-like predicted oxidoreductase
MDFTYLGRTGLRVSRLCLGTMNFGPRTSEEDAHAIMDVAHEVGINFFDTANRYGSEPGETNHHRQLVRPRRRPAGADRHCHQGLRRDG